MFRGGTRRTCALALYPVLAQYRVMDRRIKWAGIAAAAAVLALGSVALADTLLGHAAQADAHASTSSTEAQTAQLASTQRAAAAPSAGLAAASLTKSVAPPSVQSDPFVIKRILPIDGPIKYGQWYWDDKDVPPGPLVITVDLDARVMSVFRDGYEIGATAVLLGTDEHPTPLGVFPIMSKERHNISEKYNDAPMPWTLRLTSDGVAIHGGATVELGYASHGCIGTPDPFVAKLFAMAKPGDKVIITRGRMIGMGDAIL